MDVRLKPDFYANAIRNSDVEPALRAIHGGNPGEIELLAVESLRGFGLVDQAGRLTDRGREVCDLLFVPA